MSQGLSNGHPILRNLLKQSFGEILGIVRKLQFGREPEHRKLSLFLLPGYFNDVIFEGRPTS